MSRNSNRYGTYRSIRLPHDKRSILIPGSLDDNGRYYKCWNCGVTCDSQREQSDTGTYATSGVQIASNLSLLLHMDGTNGSTTFTDSSPNSHTITASGSASISTTQYKFGTASGYFSTAFDCLTIPDSSVFDLSGGVWTIGFWIYGQWNLIVPADKIVYFQGDDDSSDYMTIRCISTNAGGAIALYIYESSSAVLSLTTGLPDLLRANWHYVEVSEWHDRYMISVDGNIGWETESTVRPSDYTSTVQIGAVYAYLDEFMVMRHVNHFGRFDIPTEAYDTDAFISGAYFPDVVGGCWFCGSRNYK